MIDFLESFLWLYIALVNHWNSCNHTVTFVLLSCLFLITLSSISEDGGGWGASGQSWGNQTILQQQDWVSTGNFQSKFCLKYIYVKHFTCVHTMSFIWLIMIAEIWFIEHVKIESFWLCVCWSANIIRCLISCLVFCRHKLWTF